MILLVRHGEAEGARGRYIGRTDLPLSEQGWRQARDLGRNLAGFAPAVLYASPLARCRDTAQCIAGECGLDIVLLDDLAEIDLGDWEGRLMEDIRREQPEAYAARGRDLTDFRIPGGETFAQVQARAVKALRGIAQGPLPAIVVTHAGVIRCLLCHVQGLALESMFQIAPGHARCTVLHPKGDGFCLGGLNLDGSERLG